MIVMMTVTHIISMHILLLMIIIIIMMIIILVEFCCCFVVSAVERYMLMRQVSVVAHPGAPVFHEG
jgi:uncharacterized membrane protein YgcG